MLDRKLVTSNPELIREQLKRRSGSEPFLLSLDELIGVVELRRSLQTATDELRHEKNALSKQIGPMMREGRRDEAEPLKAKVKSISQELDDQEEQRKVAAERETELLMGLPNLLADVVPTGSSEDDNVEITKWGTIPKMDFEPKDHVSVGEDLGILDFERATKLSGARFPVYVGAAARLERALVSFFLDQATMKNGYTEVLVPYIVSRTTMTGTGQLPKFEHDLFKLTHDLNGEDAFLIPTAEVPVTNLHRDEILDESDLPIAYAAFTPCFRSEAGSYGRDTRGLIRQHQFHKVEMVRFCKPEDGMEQLELLTSHAEGLLQLLKLPYKKVLLCSGDTSFTSHITYDLEVWLPSQNTYREISSCSWFSDFQTRRMKCRFRPDANSKPQLCHTINGSGLAVGRTLVAILENYQQIDGSVTVPEILRPYMGGLATIE